MSSVLRLVSAVVMPFCIAGVAPFIFSLMADSQWKTRDTPMPLLLYVVAGLSGVIGLIGALVFVRWMDVSTAQFIKNLGARE